MNPRDWLEHQTKQAGGSLPTTRSLEQGPIGLMPGQTPTTGGEVMISIDLLKQMVAELDSTVGQLRDKLDPILVPSSPSTQETPGGPPIGTLVGSELYRIAAQLNAITRGLREIRDRVSL